MYRFFAPVNNSGNICFLDNVTPKIFRVLLGNEIQLLILTMSSIQVCIRMRPFLPDQQSLQRQRIILQQKKNTVKVQLTQQKQKMFKFNHVLNKDIQQSQLYSAINIEKLVERVVEGYHSTMFAYGQTGSGKTYTIQGGQNDKTEGIIPRSIRDLFKNIEERVKTNQNQRGFRVYLSFIQIYNETIYDLIDPGQGRPLKMRWNKLQQFTVENLFQCQCRNAEEALEWWRKGQKNKIMGSHKMNNTSSRSHCMLTLRLQNFSLEDPSDQIQSKLEIVDLAGSERYRTTKSEGVVFKEGIQINKSLFTLRQVIASLYESSTTGKMGLVPPYRDSKLTSLLKQSIGGNSYCLMIACLNPCMTHFEESLQTLTYASMASYINNAPTLNIDPKVKQNEQLKQQISNLNKEIKRLQGHIQVLTGMVQSNECSQCRKRKKSKDQNDNYEAKEPLGIVSLPRIHDKVSTNNKGEDISENKQLFLSNASSQVKAVKVLKSTKDIIESIGMIRDLITSNSLFREKIDFYKSFIQKQEKEMFVIMKENQQLRERLPNFEIGNKHITQPAYFTEFSKSGHYSEEQIKSKYRVKTLSSSNKLDKDEERRHRINYNQFLKGNSDIEKQLIHERKHTKMKKKEQ